MSSVVLFYLLAALIVSAALGAALAPTVRLSLLAVVLGDLLVGILLIAAGSRMLGAVALVVPAACLLLIAALLRRSGYTALLADGRGLLAGWPLVAGVAAIIGGLLAWVVSTRVVDTTATASGQDLLTVLHYRTPISAGLALALAAVVFGGGLLIGRTGDDERHLDRAAEQRRLREQRARMRREHRLAARAQRAGRGGDA